LGVWAALCGAVASNQLQWTGVGLLTLLLVLLLVELGWGSLWELGMNPCRTEPSTGQGAPLPARSAAALPYTQPDSPGGRLQRRLTRLVNGWRGWFWPRCGEAVLALVGAVALTVALAALLPSRLFPLHAALAGLLGLGMVWRRRGRALLLGQALALVGVSWLAGHAALAAVTAPSLVLAAAFAVAVWGALRLAEGGRRGLWLLNGGQAAAALLLALPLEEPLAAGGMGLLLFGQVALQAALRPVDGIGRGELTRRTWPWLAASMLVAACALP